MTHIDVIHHPRTRSLSRDDGGGCGAPMGSLCCVPVVAAAVGFRRGVPCFAGSGSFLYEALCCTARPHAAWLGPARVGRLGTASCRCVRCRLAGGVTAAPPPLKHVAACYNAFLGECVAWLYACLRMSLRTVVPAHAVIAPLVPQYHLETGLGCTRFSAYSRGPNWASFPIRFNPVPGWLSTLLPQAR